MVFFVTAWMSSANSTLAHKKNIFSSEYTYISTRQQDKMLKQS